jgi:hypothetical protein
MKKIYRSANQKGWYIPERFETQRQKFLDVDFGSPEQSYAAAMRELEPEDATLRKLETKSRSNKTSELPVGITHYTVRDGNQVKHRFAVCNPVTGRPQMVHIGNDNTYLRNWEPKMAVAEALRESFVDEHREMQA